MSLTDAGPSAFWERRPLNETGDSPARSARRSVAAMSSTMLTKRRAVDHCRVRSALCRMS